MAQTTSEVWDSHWSATQRSVKKEVVDNFFEDYPTLGNAQAQRPAHEQQGRQGNRGQITNQRRDR